MATVEEKASPEAAEGAGERYRYVIEKPASGEYRSVQAERAEALDRMFEGKDKLPQAMLDNIANEDFFMEGRARQQAGEVRRLIPDRFFDDEVAKREVSLVLQGLREGRSLDELQDDALLKDGKYDARRLEALKLVGARLLQEHHPEAQGKNWDEISEEEKRTVRLGEMMIHQAEMMALDRRLEEKKQAVPVEVARVFEKNYAEYAKNVDISEEQRESYRQMARFLRERVPELSGKKEELELTPEVEEQIELTPKAGAEGAESEEVLGGEERVPLEQETEVGRAADTRVDKKTAKPAVATGEYPEKDEFERKVREHMRALGEKTEGLSVFDMSEAQLLQRMTYIRGRMEKRRGSKDPKVRRGQEIVDEGLGLPEGEIGVLEKTKTKKQVREQAEAWREQLLGQVDNLISEGVEVASQSDPGLGKRLKKYEDVWLNELGLDRAEVRDNLLDKATTKWTETAYRRFKVGNREEVIRTREEFTEVLREIARGGKVKGEAQVIVDALADKFELMNLRERQKYMAGGRNRGKGVVAAKAEVAEAQAVEESVQAEVVEEVGEAQAEEEPPEEGKTETVEGSGGPEEVLGGEEMVPLEQETEVGRAAGDTAVVKEVQESTGERSVKEIEGEMRSVYRQVREMGGAGSGSLGEKVLARKQPELEGLRRRWGELRDEIHTRAARERLQSVTVDWLEKAEREVEGILSVPPGLAEEWAEKHDWEEKGLAEREERKIKTAPHVRQGKRLKPLRKRGTKRKQGGV